MKKKKNSCLAIKIKLSLLPKFAQLSLRLIEGKSLNNFLFCSFLCFHFENFGSRENMKENVRRKKWRGKWKNIKREGK